MKNKKLSQGIINTPMIIFLTTGVKCKFGNTFAVNNVANIKSTPKIKDQSVPFLILSADTIS